MNRGPKEKLAIWVEMWNDHTVPASDVAYVLQRLLAETGDAGLFALVPPDVQQELLSINDKFKQTGTQELGVPGGIGFVDASETAARCIRVLEASSLANPSLGAGQNAG